MQIDTPQLIVGFSEIQCHRETDKMQSDPIDSLLFQTQKILGNFLPKKTEESRDTAEPTASL